MIDSPIVKTPSPAREPSPQDCLVEGVECRRRANVLDWLTLSFIPQREKLCMNPRSRIHRDARRRSWLQNLIVAGFLLQAVAAFAQAPVITNPGDLRVLSVNAALRPGDSTPAWLPAAPMPTSRAAFATAAADGRIYVIGGVVLDDCIPSNIVEAYNPAGDYWTTGLQPLPPPARFRPSGASLDSMIYVVGGSTTTSECNDTPLGTVQAYDPANDRWANKASLLTARLQGGLGVDEANHLLYAVGGATGAPDYFALSTVEVYDPVTNTWKALKHLNTPRAAPAVAAVNGKIYAIGGQKQKFGVVDSVEEFNPATNTWTLKSSVMPHPRVNSAAAVLNGKVYIIGGASHGALSTVDVYDPLLDQWTTGVSLPTPRRLLGAAVVDNTIYAVGGGAPEAKVGEPFTYQITATNNPTYYNAFPLPDGLRVDHDRGIITGTPTTPADAFVMTFFASNENGFGTEDVSLTIAQQRSVVPELGSIMSGTCVTGRAGQPFSFQVLANASTSETPFAASGLPYVAGQGPELTIDPGTGVISGTVTVTRDDSSQSFGTQLGLMNLDSAQSFLQLTFVSDPFLPVITSGSIAPLPLNEFFSYTITTDAPTTSLSYFGLDGALNGALPNGLTFDRITGTFSGIYTAADPVRCGRRFDRQDSIDHGIKTIKKEPPPRIQMLTQNGVSGTGTAPLNFIVSLHDFEAETLGVKSSEGAKYVILSDQLASAGELGFLQATQVDDVVTYQVRVAQSGTYDVRIGTATGPDQGIYQLAIDGVDQGPVQDQYSPGIGYVMHDLGPVTFSNPGEKSFQLKVTGRNPNSAGYELSCDYIDLVPFSEAEGLVVRGHSAPYQRVRDKNLSGGRGLLLKADTTGDSLTCSVPVVRPGYYDLMVRAKPLDNGVTFQLLVDGVPQGYPQAESQSSTSSDWGIHDLGTVRFLDGSNRNFKFVVTGGNGGPGGYDLLLDYIDLVAASQFEAENLPVTGTQTFKPVLDRHLSGRTGILFAGKEVGDYISFNVEVPLPGTYRVKAGVRRGPRNGTVQLAIDDTNQGLPRDTYSAELDYAVVDFGTVAFTEAGEKTFQFLITGRDPQSKDYQFVLDYLNLVR